MQIFFTEMPLLIIAAFVGSRSCLHRHPCNSTPFAVKMSIYNFFFRGTGLIFWGGIPQASGDEGFAYSWCPHNNGKHYTSRKIAFKV